MKISKALSIAGSDNSCGAGLQADLKTFSALGVYGMTVVTSVTAQNTLKITTIHDIPKNVIKAQIESLVNDIGVDIVKTGMLHTKTIIKAVSDKIKKHNLQTIVDPVIISKDGTYLVKQDAINTLIKSLFPLATIVTPNAIEAEIISGIEIKSIDDVKKAAKKIIEFGCNAVVIKGGHIFSDDVVVDVLYYKKKFKLFKGDKLNIKTTHGTGCIFASAIAAELLKGNSIINSVSLAKEFTFKAIKFGFDFGKGFRLANPMITLYNEAEKIIIKNNIVESIKLLASNSEFSNLIPESQSNIVMALPFACNVIDVAAIPGRIVKIGNKVKASSCPEFGASSHVARTVLTIMKYNREIRAGLNIRYSKKIIDSCKKLNFKISNYDRKKEPLFIKKNENKSTSWGAEQAIKKIGQVPDIIYHKGDWGKEPMIILLGKTAIEVANKALKIIRHIKKLD